MLTVPNRLRANLDDWKNDPRRANHLPATVLPPQGPPKHTLGEISSAKERDNNPAFDSDPRSGIIVDPKSGDTVTLSKHGNMDYFERVEADGDVDAFLSNDRGVFKVNYYIPDGKSEYSAYQSYVPMEEKEGWHALRKV